MARQNSDMPRSRDRSAVSRSESPRSASVFSYYANRDISDSARIRDTEQVEQLERPRKRRWFTLRNVLTSIAVIIVFAVMISLNSKPKVVILGDSSSQFALQDQKAYQKDVSDILSTSLSNGNKITFDASSVANKLISMHPELHAASISLPFFGRTATVYIQPSIPQIVLSTLHDGQVVLGSSGVVLGAYTSHMQLPSSRAVPIIEDQSGYSVQRGRIALPSQSVTFISQIAGQLYSKSIVAQIWTLSPDGNELDVKVSGMPYIVKFNLQGEARVQAGNFLAAKNYLDSKQIKPAQYIDARVIGKVFYK